MKGILAVVLGFIIVLPSSMQAEETPGLLDSLSGANKEALRFPAVSFSDLQAYAPAEKSDWIGAQEVAFSSLPRPAVRAPVRTVALLTRDSSKEMAEPLSAKSPYHVSGEVGALYGVSTGKYGAETEAGYIIGGVGNDKIQITAGASYENTTFHLPRMGR